MLALKTLDVVIGIAFVFLLLSTLCAALREVLEAVLKTRAAYLERGVRELLHDPDGTGLARSLFAHPLLTGLFVGAYRPPAQGKRPALVGRGLPSYIPAQSFALALLDIAGRGAVTDEVSTDPGSVPLTVATIRARLLNIDNVAVRRVILTALDASHGDLQRAAAQLEHWFDSAMDRVSGWYKRSTQWIVLGIALVVTVAMNVDTLALAAHLYASEDARAVAVAAAEEAVRNGPPGARVDTVATTREALEALRLPLGWSETRGLADVGLSRVLGWLITAIAATLGTPFWFDVLNKVMVIRSTVKPREKSREEGSEDRPAAPVPTSARGALPGEPGVLASPTSAMTAPAGPLAVVMPRDPHDEHDGCGEDGDVQTPDEALPQAFGGVA